MSSVPRPHETYDPVELTHPSHINQRASSRAGVHTQPLSDLHQDQAVPTSMSHNSYTQRDPHSPDSTEPIMYPPQHPLQPERRPSSSQSSLPLAPGNSGYAGPSQGYDVERGQPPDAPAPGMPQPSRPANSRTQSWDLLSGIKKFEHSYEEFDSRNASEAHLAFADGDVPKNKLSSLYHYLLNVSIVSRWILFIVPVLGILWIPGILGLTTFPKAAIWGVKLIWWSIWLSVAWGGWWAALATSRIMPSIIRTTVGLVAVGTRRYIDWMEALHRYVALFAWTLANWISWNPLIDRQQQDGTGENAIHTIDLIGRLLFAFYLCAAVLLFEKFSIQWIAGKFHERSYAERIADQKFAVRSLVTLYRNSADIPGRSDTMHSSPTPKGSAVDPRRFFKKAMKGVRMAATTTTTAFGNVASEIAGSSVLQPNSPQAMVKTALESANKSRLLARRLFYSFAKPNSEYLFVGDIARFFPNADEADRVYALFDKDSNGDASREEVEMACMEFHREQLSLEHSMQDLDSAVGRLDNILMTLYVVIAILIIAVALEAQLVTLVTGAGTLILGLSWLIGGSLQEVLTSIIFLFIKHPFDVGDRVNLAKDSYTVKEIRLLSTIFLDSNGTFVQAPNTELNSMFIQNIRRSPQMSETFTFDVNYATTFEDLERLREKMLAFLKAERRDFQAVFDVAVVDFPDQESMKLTVDIKYKSNSQQGGLKAKRRNKWICALKTALAEVEIFGPKGDPDAIPVPKRYTKVPWETVQTMDRSTSRDQFPQPEPRSPVVGWKLTDQNAAILDNSGDVFGESNELHMTNPRRGLSQGEGLHNRPTAAAAVTMPTPVTMPLSSSGSASHGPEVIEMAARP